MTETPTATPPSAPPGRSRRRLGSSVFIVVALVVVVFGVIFSQRFGEDPNLVDSPLIGTQAPAVVLPLLEFEGEVDLSDAAGDILVVNFWASWCLPCRSEHPELNAAAAEFETLDVRFIGILHQDSPANGIAFLDELGRGSPYTYLWDDRSRAALAYGVLGLPETYFVNRDGIIVGKVTGPVNRDVLVNALNDLVLGREVGGIRTGEVQNR